MRFETLPEATRRYRLRDGGMSNAVLARCLEVRNGNGDHLGSPSCCFFWEGYLAAIRTKPDELAIFHLYQAIQDKMAGVGDRIE